MTHYSEHSLKLKYGVRMKILYVPILALILSACATTSGSDPIVGFSGFDNAKTVSISPHGNACSSMLCTGLGAQWNSSNPESAILIVRVFNEYAVINHAELNIDGKKIELASVQTVTDFGTPSTGIHESSKAFGVPLTVIEQIISANKVWLRVSTPSGYIEDPVKDGSKDSKAYHALSRFVLAIKS